MAKMTARCAQYMSALKIVCKRKSSRRLRKNLHITILSLFISEIIFEVFQPMWSRYLNVADGLTDGQYTVASPLGKNRETKFHRCYWYRRYFKLKLPVYCRFKQVNGITTAKEITEEVMQVTESTIITKNVHSCWIVRMSRWTTEADRSHRLTLTLNVT